MIENYDFIKENCQMCGSQRCDPTDEEWIEGCLKFQEYKKEKKE